MNSVLFGKMRSTLPSLLRLPRANGAVRATASCLPLLVQFGRAPKAAQESGENVSEGERTKFRVASQTPGPAPGGGAERRRWSLDGDRSAVRGDRPVAARAFRQVLGLSGFASSEGARLLVCKARRRRLGAGVVEVKSEASLSQKRWSYFLRPKCSIHISISQLAPFAHQRSIHPCDHRADFYYEHEERRSG